MITSPMINRYEVVLGDTYFLREIVESITLSESFGEIAYRADICVAATPDFPGISQGQNIRVSGTPPGSDNMITLLHPAVVWEINSTNPGQQHIEITAYDKAIYLKSEDEYILKPNRTASERLAKYAGAWRIPVGRIEDTRIPLAKAVYRKQSIYSMIQRDLSETAAKGGGIFRVRMGSNGLDLVKIGSNDPVWVLDPDNNVEEITQRRTLEGACTRVKVFGANPSDTRTNVIAVVSGDTAQYGTIQKVLQESRLTNGSEAQVAGKRLLSTPEDMESFQVRGIDINTIRVGDKVELSKMPLIVTNIRHELGSPGHISMVLEWESSVRKKYYLEGFEHNGSI